MRVLVISARGQGLGIAWRMRQEGHSVSIAISQPGFDLTGSGLYSKGVSWRPMLEDADFVVCDEPGYGVYEKVMRRTGTPVVGSSLFGDMVNGRKQKEMLDGLEGVDMAPPMCSTIEHIVWIHGWFNGREWVHPFLVSHKESTLFPGGLGPVVDCMGCVAKAVDRDSALVRLSLEGLTDRLKRLGIKGLVSMPILLEDDGVLRILAVYCGLYYDVMEAMGEGLREPLTDLLFDVSTGIKKEMSISNDYLISVRVTIPPWPYPVVWDGDENGGREIRGIDEHNLPHLYLCDVYRGEDGYRTGKGSRVVVKAAARGRSIREARRRVYRTLDNIEVREGQYRLDIGEKAEQVFERLKDYGI